MSQLEMWRNTLRQLDLCPWPGPRPMVDDDPDERLVQRNRDSNEFASAVLDHSLVVLTGESGVGKTSLLHKKLIPRLECEGFLVLPCREWASAEHADPAVLVAKTVHDRLDGINSPVDDAKNFWSTVQAKYGANAVLILDQFEELVRYQPQLFERALTWILDLNRAGGIRVVISLRAEYLPRLRRLELGVRPFTMTTFFLRPLVRSEEIRAVIDSGRLQEGQAAITPGAADDLVSRWNRYHNAYIGDVDGSEASNGARGEVDTMIEDAFAVEPVGLLHVQAVLYALSDRAVGRQITVEDIGWLQRQAKAAARQRAANGDGDGRRPLRGSIFAFGLEQALKVKLRRCAEASRELKPRLDEFLIAGTDTIVRRIVPHLSSGGFKLVREQRDLLERAVGEELTLLKDAVEVDGLYASMVGDRATGGDLLSFVAPDRLPKDLETDAYYVRGVDWVPWHHDENDLTAGPMLGMPLNAVAREVLRRFMFAIEWLERSAIIRTSTPNSTDTMVSLVHDGFGPALTHFAAGHIEPPESAISSVTVLRGRELDWLRANSRSDDKDAAALTRPVGDELPSQPLRGEPGDERVIANARWRDCTVRASIAHVLFVNCDFRGTRFDDSRFEGVTFVNCLLDNASITESTIVGETNHQPPGNLENIADKYLPNFEVPVSPALANTLARYRGLTIDTNTKGLYSRTSGVAAIPRDGGKTMLRDDGHLPGITWVPQTGGLTMMGGRLSSLQIRHCAFDGTLAIRHLAGAALDVVEHVGGHLDLFDTAIRGLTVSAPVNRASVVGPTELIGTETFLANTWFGTYVTGNVQLQSSQVRQLVALDPELHLTFDDCYVTGASTASHPESSGLFEERATMLDRDELVVRVMRTDYRSRPAELEIERLIAHGKFRTVDLPEAVLRGESS